MTNEQTLTYQTRLQLTFEQDQILQEYAYCLSGVERALYAEVVRGNKAVSRKNDFLKIHEITARQFNACRISLEGKIAAWEAGRKMASISLQLKIASLDKEIKNLQRNPSKRALLHLKKRRRETLSLRLAAIENDLKEGRTRICFGSKKLFHAQFHLEENGFSSLEEWKKTWDFERNNEFFILGSKDEAGCNQTCTAYLQENGELILRLRLPKALEKKFGKYIKIENVSFEYGYEAIVSNLLSKQALSYRFKKDDKGWRVFLSTALKEPEIVSRERTGVVGIDLNADHIAYVETDRFGNPVKREAFSWVSYGKNKRQLKAITGDLCKEIVNRALEAKKPIVIENLDFYKKKLSLKETRNEKFARLLSSMAYGLFFVFLRARAFKFGIAVHKVNPAFTSVIGRVNYAKRYGLSIHLAAALCIARRYQQFSESPLSFQRDVPDGKGGHVAFVLPVRNRMRHVWHFWKVVKQKLSAVLAAHFRAICIHRSLDPPLQSILVTGNSRLLPV